MILKKGYPLEKRQEIADRILKKQRDLPSFWRGRYRDRMKDIIELQLQVSALKSQLSDRSKSTHLGLQPAASTLSIPQVAPVDDMQCM